MQEKVDLLIIGQGLAGSVLALSAQKRGMRTLVVDNGWQHSASMVAAGMWNPVSFRRIIEVWRAEETMTHLERFYPEAEALLNNQFYHPKPVMRVFPNREYAELWQQRLDEGMPWIQPASQLPDGVEAPFGAGEVPRAGYLHIPRFLAATKKHLEQHNAFLSANFAEEDVEQLTDGVRYKGIFAKRIVIATGVAARQLELMHELPLRTNKGEVLDVKVDGFQDEITVNNGKWLLPYEGEVYKLGASYEWQRSDEETTDEVRDALLEKVKQMVKHPVEVVDHRAGLRPTVKDRRALVGKLKREHWYVFNGLGTRGVLIAPYLANAFCEMLGNNNEEHPNPEVDSLRFL